MAKIVDLKGQYEKDTTELVAESLRLMESGHSSVYRDWRSEEKVESVYIGTCFSILPSSKYYIIGLTSNQSWRDVVMDGFFMEQLNSKLDQVHMWIQSGEGSASDLFICRQADQEAKITDADA